MNCSVLDSVNLMFIATVVGPQIMLPYCRIGRTSVLHSIGPLLVDVGLKFERAEMQMIRWMCGISLKDRRTNEELRRLVGVEPITTSIRSGRLRWYGHVMRTG